MFFFFFFFFFKFYPFSISCNKFSYKSQKHIPASTSASSLVGEVNVLALTTNNKFYFSSKIFLYNTHIVLHACNSAHILPSYVPNSVGFRLQSHIIYSRPSHCFTVQPLGGLGRPLTSSAGAGRVLSPAPLIEKLSYRIDRAESDFLN